ncbi:RDD family protein [Streptomyces sp. NPDC079020]|uniref:RDD family protein n=1 Tax=Streptomyces sp. NPDC079020 TaxID=3365722 RepID=UPI0037D1E7FC
MSAPTPAPGDESPREGYYPDPSIPGYVRYWNGAAWVPGTSRPAPRGEATSAPRQASSVPRMEETGPIFFDEVGEAGGPDGVPDGAGGPEQGVPARTEPEPASVWQADTSRQTGFGGDRDRRVSWGGPEAASGRPDPAGADPRTPAGGARPERAEPAPADPRVSGAPDPMGGALPGMREGGDSDGGSRDGRGSRGGGGAGVRPPTDGTVTIRAVGPGGGARTPRPREAGPVPADGTMTIRAATPVAGPPGIMPGGTQQGPQGPQAVQPSQAPQAPQSPHSSHAPQAPHASQQPQVPQPTRVQEPARTTVLPSAALPAATQGPVRVPGPAQPPAPAPAPAPGPGGSTSWGQQAHQPARPEQHQPQGQPQPQGQHQPQGQPQPPQQQMPPQQRMTAPQPVPAQQQAGAGADQPVVPWKPPVDDPFQQLARAQTSARPAGLGKRFAARLLDSLVLGAVLGAVGFPLVSRALDHIDEKITAAKQSGETVTVWLVDATTAGLFGAVLGAFLVLGFLLEALPTAKWGRTLGKKLLGLDVRDIESHDSPTLGAALRRWLVYGVLGILVIGVFNVLWCLIDRPWRQCWHDKAARTFVAG